VASLARVHHTSRAVRAGSHCKARTDPPRWGGGRQGTARDVTHWYPGGHLTADTVHAAAAANLPSAVSSH